MLRPQGGTVAHALPNLPREPIEERWYRPSGICHAEGGIAAREHPVARAEDVIAQLDVLARNVWLVCPTAVVSPDDAAVRRRPLRPIDPAVPVEGQLLGR